MSHLTDHLVHRQGRTIGAARDKTQQRFGERFRSCTANVRNHILLASSYDSSGNLRTLAQVNSKHDQPGHFRQQVQVVRPFGPRLSLTQTPNFCTPTHREGVCSGVRGLNWEGKRSNSPPGCPSHVPPLSDINAAPFTLFLCPSSSWAGDCLAFDIEPVLVIRRTTFHIGEKLYMNTFLRNLCPADLPQVLE